MDHQPLYDEKELLSRVAKGDEAAFTQLFNQYRDKIYSIALPLTRSEDAAEELVQDIFLRLWVKRELLREVENFENYLFIITRNEAYRFLKKLAKRKTVGEEALKDLPLADLSIESTLSEKELRTLVQQAIDNLPPQQKKVYQLIKEQGLSRKEVAEKLSVGQETVKTHLEKAMRSLRAWCMSRLDLFSLAFALWSKNYFVG